MWTIVIPLLAGYVLAAKRPAVVDRLPVSAIINISLVLLLLVMGARIGADDQVVSQIVQIGIQALALAAVTVAGSVLVLWLLQFWLRGSLQGDAQDELPQEGDNGHRLTLLLLGSVMAGVALGLLVLPPGVLPYLNQITVWLLGLLLLGIGLDLGRAGKAFSSLRHMGLKIVLLPLGVAVGSILGAFALIGVWNIMTWNEAAALASGFGWYSLSAVLLSELHSPLLGAMAFVANVFREFIAIVITPLVAKFLGPLPSIAPGGATTMDVLLPVIAKGTGRAYVPLAFFSGAVLSLAVAVLVNLFIGL